MAKRLRRRKEPEAKRGRTRRQLPLAPLTGLAIRRILVPIDFSEYSKNALRYAVPFAKHFGAELIVLYVVEPTIYPADFSFGHVGLPNIEEELRKQSAEELERLAKSIAKKVSVRHEIRTGRAFLEIIEAAKEEEADLIIIATHGHTGVEHILFGSTAEKVVRKAHCPVLTVRSSHAGR